MIKVFQAWLNRYFMNEETVLLVVLLVAALIVLMTMGNILAPAMAALVLAFLLQGLVSTFEQWRLSHLAAVWLTFSLFVGAIALLLLIVMPLVTKQLTSLATEIPKMVNQLQSLVTTLPERYPGVLTREDVMGVFNIGAEQMGEIGKSVLSASVANLTNAIALLIYLILVPILIFFFLKDNKVLLGWLAAFLPGERPIMNKIWLEMNEQIANYVRGKFIEILIVGAVTFVSFRIMGLNYSALLGVLVGLSVVIPYIGAAVVTIPVAVIAFFQWGWGSEFFYAMVVYGVIQALDGNVLVPLLFSEAVNLHPVAIILAVLVFGGFWGLWGVFFAIPLATLIKAILNAWPKKEESAMVASDVR